MELKSKKGLKFPDESIIRFFFKENLSNNPGRVLELGCGNGNNLELFYQFGHSVTGIDIDRQSIENAEFNAELLKAATLRVEACQFSCEDMVSFVEGYQGEPFETILIPSSLYYLRREDILKVLKALRDRKLVKPGTKLFLRMRNLDDYRYGKGTPIASDSFLLNIRETGEWGCTNTFFSESDLIRLLEGHFRFKTSRILLSKVENLQSDHIIMDSDIIFWGEVAEV